MKKWSFSHIKIKLIGYGFMSIDFLVYWLLKTIFQSHKKQIGEASYVYIGEYFPPRIQRLINNLKTSVNANFVLYISKWGYQPKLIGDSFDKIYIYRNKYHLLTLLNKVKNIIIVHSFEPKAYYQWLANKNMNTPFIYDIQDIQINYYSNTPPLKWQKFTLPYEKALLNSANGLISQSLELKEAIRNHKIKKHGRVLFFPLFCDENNFKNLTKTDISLITKLNLVYIGGINGINDNNSANFLPLIKQISTTQCKFTIFPSPASEIHFYNEYKSIESQFTNFHMNNSVPFDKINLSEYGFGVMPFDHPTSETYFSKNLYASSLKFFIYLEWGVPIIISEYWRYLAWLVKRYNLGIITNFNNLGELDTQIISFDYLKCMESIELFRNKFSLQKNIPKMTAFYSQVIKDFHAENPQEPQ